MNCQIHLFTLVSVLSLTWAAAGQPCSQWKELFLSDAGQAEQRGTYDQKRQAVVYLTRGSIYSSFRFWLWAYDGDRLTLLADGGPPPNQGTSIAYDPVHDCIWAIVPDAQCCAERPSEIWRWNESEGWQLIDNQQLPTREYCAFGFNAVNGKMMICGGSKRDGQRRPECWYWDGTTVTPGPALPEACKHGNLYFDTTIERVVLMGAATSGPSGYAPVFHLSPDNQWTLLYAYVGQPGDQVSPMSCCYDQQRGVTVGLSQSNRVFEWDWSKLSWRQFPSGTWGATWSAPVVYDEHRGVVAGWTTDGRATTWSGEVWAQPQLTHPGMFADATFTWDSLRQTAVLFGGIARDMQTDRIGRINETWEYNRNGWTRRTVPGPSARDRHAAAFDSTRGVTVVFGGFDSARRNDTWEYDGHTWVERNISGPSARINHAMTYDEARGVVVMFGGYDGALNGETWEYDGVSWSFRASTGPSPRQSHAMAYDPSRGMVMLHGGATGLAFSNETWQWNGSQWSLVATGPDLSKHGMAYDLVQEKMVLHGGRSSFWGSPTNVVWTLNDTSWTAVAWTMVGGVAGHGFVYDSTAQRFLRIGGNTAPPGQAIQLIREFHSLRLGGPRITTQPNSVSREYGETASFIVVVDPIGTPSFQWRYDGVNLVDNGRVSGATGPALSINGVVPADAGTYDVVITESCGAVTSAVATLDVQCPPIVFTQQPQPQNVVVGGTVSLSATATGVGSLGYQWLRNGANVVDGGRFTGAMTPALTITSVQFEDEGEYSLRVTDACGASTSDSVGVAVLCRADWNRDGIVNSTDVAAFINDWFTDIAAGTLVTDLSGNGVVNSTDVALFVDEFFATPAACL